MNHNTIVRSLQAINHIVLITFGESWHNNHHANAKDWKQGLKWWEIDLTSWIIRLIKVNT